MTVTVEPGYYDNSNFGIRHENVLVITKAKTEHNFQGKQFFCMTPVTWVPFQTSILDISLLSEFEASWLNSYNAECGRKLLPLLEAAGDQNTFAWLEKEIRPI